MGAFSFREDIKKVQWGRTLGLNLLRAAAAGVVWGIIMLFASGGSPAPDAPPWFALPFILPIGYLFVLPLFMLTAKIFVAFTGGIGELAVGLATIFFGLGLAVGDPLVFTLHRLKPALVPTEKFNFINFALILFVLDPNKI